MSSAMILRIVACDMFIYLALQRIDFPRSSFYDFQDSVDDLCICAIFALVMFFPCWCDIIFSIIYFLHIV